MFIAPDSRCENCGTTRNAEVHHIEPRRMGGSRRPEIEAPSNKAVLCRSCHTQITEQRWRLDAPTASSWSPKWRRERSSPAASSTPTSGRRSTSTSSTFWRPASTPSSRGSIPHGRPARRPLVLLSWPRPARLESPGGNPVGGQAEKRLRGPGLGSHGAQLRHRLAAGVQPSSSVGGLLQGGGGHILQSIAKLTLEEATWYVVAAGADNPHFWLAYAEDRKAENPAYTTSDFREEIGWRGRSRKDFCAARWGKPSCRWLRDLLHEAGADRPAGGLLPLRYPHHITRGGGT